MNEHGWIDLVLGGLLSGASAQTLPQCKLSGPFCYRLRHLIARSIGPLRACLDWRGQQTPPRKANVGLNPEPLRNGGRDIGRGAHPALSGLKSWRYEVRDPVTGVPAGSSERDRTDEP